MALSLPTPVGHLLDPDTLALWRFDEASGTAALVDAAGNYQVPCGGPNAPVAGRVGGARVISVGNGFLGNPGGPTDPSLAAALTGAWTYEGWAWVDPSVTGTAFPGPGGGYGVLAALRDNVGDVLFLGLSSTGQLIVFSTQTGEQVVGGNWSNLARGTWHHYAFRATPTGGGKSTIDYFVDGVKTASTPNYTIPTTAAVAPFWNVGIEVANFNAFTGRLDDARFSKVARTDAEIFDSYRRGALGLGPSAVGSLSKITDHATRAATALIEQYKDKPKVIGLLTAFVNQVQKSEDGLWPALSERNLQCASGAELDLLGGVVGEPRLGRSDVSYRTFIQAKILLNLSSGTIEELYAIFALLISVNGLACTMQVVEHYPKAFDLVLHGAAVPDAIAADFAKVLKSAKDAGARAYLEYGNTTPFFGFDGNGSGFDVGYFGGDL